MNSFTAFDTLEPREFIQFYQEFTGYELNLDCEKDSFFLSRIQRLEFGEYKPIFQKVEELGFKSVYDIGCGYGLHIPWFLKKGYNYVGIDEFEDERFKKLKDNCNLILGQKYPFKLNPGPNSCAISVACIGSRFTEQEIPAQMTMLSSEFSHFFCYTFSDSHEIIKKFWKHSECLFQSNTQHSYMDSETIHYWN